MTGEDARHSTSPDLVQVKVADGPTSVGRFLGFAQSFLKFLFQ